MSREHPALNHELVRLEQPPSGHLSGTGAGTSGGGTVTGGIVTGRTGGGVTERTGGVSSGPYRSLNLGRSTPDDPEHVRINEEKVLTALGLPDKVARLRLEHGAKVLMVDEPALYGPADGLLTSRADLTLWLTVADCFPLLLAGGEFRALGHCGWRGVAAGLVEGLVQALRVEAGESVPIRAWIGPGIGACCYPIGPEVARLFPRDSLQDKDGRVHLDLRAEIGRRLRQERLDDDAVASSESCTACEEARFFSHRRDGFPSGRMAALSWARRDAIEELDRTRQAGRSSSSR